MHYIQAQADHSWALKDAYVHEIKNTKTSDRLIPFNAQAPIIAKQSQSDFGADKKFMNEFQQKRGAELGQTSGVMIDVASGAKVHANDGIGKFVLRDGNEMLVYEDSDAAIPEPSLNRDVYSHRMSGGLQRHTQQWLRTSPDREPDQIQTPAGVEVTRPTNQYHIDAYNEGMNQTPRSSLN